MNYTKDFEEDCKRLILEKGECKYCSTFPSIEDDEKLMSYSEVIDYGERMFMYEESEKRKRLSKEWKRLVDDIFGR